MRAQNLGQYKYLFFAVIPWCMEQADTESIDENEPMEESDPSFPGWTDSEHSIGAMICKTMLKLQSRE